MLKKIIFLVFRNKYRYSSLANFGKSKKYGDVLLISLGGRIKVFIGKILYYLKLGKFISIDGDPFFENNETSINLWFGGSSFKITKKYRGFLNNYVNINNPVLHKEKKIFQIYPIIKQQSQINRNPSIIFMGGIFFQPNNEKFISSKFLDDNNQNLLTNFELIDQKKFWRDISTQDERAKFENYRICKTYIREKTIIEIYKSFKKNVFFYGEDYKNTGIQFLKPVFKLNKIKKIYKGNICIDTGPITGSISLHPRSIQIIESGGLLLQAKQEDSPKVWGDLSDDIISNNIEKLLSDIDQYLSNVNKSDEVLNKLFNKFQDSKEKINLLLNSIF